MAKLSDIGEPGPGKGILLPYRQNVESEWVYRNRCQFVRDDDPRAERLKQLLSEFQEKLRQEELLPLSLY